nr:ABC transporter permease [Kineosporia babensis]
MLRPLLRAALLLLISSLLVFLAAAALPGDAVEVRSGGRASAEQLAALRAEAGLDRPVLVRWADWLTGLLTGDLGRSLVTGREVADLVTGRLWVSSALVLGSLLVVVPLTAVLAWAGARGPAALRSIVSAGSTAVAALPQVVVAVVLVAIFSVALDLVPPVSLLPAQAPWTRPDLLFLPVLTLALPTAAYTAALLRGALEDATGLPHVKDARVRGLPRRTILARYLVPAVAPTAVRSFAVVTGSLIAGTTLVESVFGMAGLGELLVTSVGSRDAPVVQAVAMLVALAVVLGLWLADVVAVLTDPRGSHA